MGPRSPWYISGADEIDLCNCKPSFERRRTSESAHQQYKVDVQFDSSFSTKVKRRSGVSYQKELHPPCKNHFFSSMYLGRPPIVIILKINLSHNALLLCSWAKSYSDLSCGLPADFIRVITPAPQYVCKVRFTPGEALSFLLLTS